MKPVLVVAAVMGASFIAYAAELSDSHLGLASIFDVYFLAYIAALYTGEFLLGGER